MSRVLAVALLAMAVLAVASSASDTPSLTAGETAAARARMEKFIENYTSTANKKGKDASDKVKWVGSFRSPDGILNDPANSLPFKGVEEVAMAYDGLFANLDTFFSPLAPDMFVVSKDGKTGDIIRIQLVSATQHFLGPKYEFHFPAWIRYHVDLSGKDVKIIELIACWDKIGAKLDQQYKDMGWRKTGLDILNAKNAAVGLGVSRALAYANSISDTEAAAGTKALTAAKSLVDAVNGGAGGRSQFLALFADDAVIVDADGETASGKAAIGTVFDRIAKATLKLEHTYLAAWRVGIEVTTPALGAARWLVALVPNENGPVQIQSVHMYHDNTKAATAV